MALTLSITPTPTAGGEHDLVAAARRGDDRAFGELYARYQQRIFGFILAKVRDHGRAEDIAQEVFISALRRLRSSDQQIAFKPWIYEIAKNACIDEFRRGTRTREVPMDADGDFDGAQRGLPSVVPTPPAAVESKQRIADLRGAFGGLSDSHHKLLVLREFEGRSYEEIGDRMGMTRQMVESGLFRARRKLTDEYDELASGRRCEQVQSAIDAGSARSIRSLGIRERRRFSRHLAHCQTCRRQARLAGVDEALIQPPSVTKKIAALLPFPLWRWPWRAGRGRGGAPGSAASSGSRHLVATESLRSAAQIAEPAGSSVTLGQAAAAAAALAIAGAGGGLVSGLAGHRHSSHRSTAVLAAASTQDRAPAATRSAAASRSSAAPAKRARVAGVDPARRRNVRRIARVDRVSPASRVSAAQPLTGSPGAGAPTTTPTQTPAGSSGAVTATAATGISGASLPTPVTPSKLTGTARSTVSAATNVVSTARNVVSTASHSILSSAPASSTPASVQSTISGVLSGSASTTTASPGATTTPAPTLKSTVSALLPK